MTPRQEAAWHMLEELRAWRPEVVLVPAPEPRHSGHMVRIRCDQPPEWYSEMLFRAGFSRKGQGRLRRISVIRGLERELGTATRKYVMKESWTGDLLKEAIDRETEKYREEIPF